MNVPAGISTNSMPMLLENVGSNAIWGAGELALADEAAPSTIDSQKKIREAEGRVEWTGQ
jgi:hypothetical protein